MIELRIRFRTLAIVATTALSLVVAGTAIGATLAKTGGPVAAVRTATADDRVSIRRSDGSDGSFTWTNVPGMTASVPVPSGETGLLLVTFSGMSQCMGTPAFCQVRVVVDGNVASPGIVVFDSTDDGPGGSVNSYETNSMQFVAGPKRAGPHTVTVQWAISPFSQATFELSARTLTVLRSKV